MNAPRHRPPVACLAVVLALVLVSGPTGCTDRVGSRAATSPVPATAGPSGRQVFEESRCARCHTIAEPELKKLGGDLDGVGARRDASWLREYLKDPASKVEAARMPPAELPEAELDALIRYLQSLK